MQLLKLQPKHYASIEQWNATHENKYVICSTQYGDCVEYSEEMEAYLQDAETIGMRITNTEIRGVTYDWERNRCIIQIADEFFPVHEFDCTAEWTSDDCVAAIQSLVDNQ